MLAPISLSVLLASILFSPAEAVPTPRNVGLITLPLTRMHKARDDVHPQILLQQHANRAHRRLARMTGKREPSAEEMKAAIQKRMVIVGNGVEALRNKQTQKRKYTVGKVDSELSRIREGAHVAAAQEAPAAGGNSVIVTTITTTITAAAAQQTSASAQSTVTEFVTVTAGAAQTSAPAEVANSTNTASSAAPSATGGAGNGTAAAPDSNKDGFSPVDLAAAING
ncbi:hypothetical protein FRC08_013649, partial [Ceratobasidium sp. 394]